MNQEHFIELVLMIGIILYIGGGYLFGKIENDMKEGFKSISLIFLICFTVVFGITGIALFIKWWLQV